MAEGGGHRCPSERPTSVETPLALWIEVGAEHACKHGQMNSNGYHALRLQNPTLKEFRCPPGASESDIGLPMLNLTGPAGAAGRIPDPRKRFRSPIYDFHDSLRYLMGTTHESQHQRQGLHHPLKNFERAIKRSTPFESAID